ncbi:ubiquitin carboxyl-terminal hydrolase 27 isoform X2 [Olea europaea var. sylvestris]|uniref:ubiquitin carboxyl-terminal hydrolase 27 isoform X2 n=1 Tax=Olea europaea var. sylvestris TaxID=158386 RepID=UPI000C1D8646|nr:ubiquitin carboxyl-terminal hydrolase 27 isoform X2 [Olea europaea var. sylvestris]
MKIQESIKISSLIPKLSKFLPERNWGSASGLKISAAVGVLGAASIILAVKDKFLNFNNLLLLSDSDSEKYWAVPGLQNFGNNCFLNVILQALASCSSFRKYLEKTVEEFKFSSDRVESTPLVNALSSLMEELGTVRHGRAVLSPRKLMLAMDNYFPSFNLTSQQDAEEAFSHLLSSLREELSEQYVPDRSYLADLTSPHHRIRIVNSSNGWSEWQRWLHSFLGPFDGIVGSILVCQSCSIQMEGCSLEDCLNHFLVAEHLENYCCSHCWHNAAIKYVSTVAEDKTDVEKLQSCTHDDSCDCKTLSSLQGLPWSNRFCRAFKQLSIARSPKILCIHLQRASANVSGQSVKLRGHLSFPLSLDLSLFMKSEVGIKNWEESLKFKLSKNQWENISSRTKIAKESERNTVALPDNNCLKASIGGPSLLENSGFADTIIGSMPALSNDKEVSTTPSKPRIYRLVSVVEHFGNVGSGHYMVYRRVTAKLGAEDPIALLESAIDQWFCISDSEVRSVSEKDVLNANASMLFYEKIVEH